MAVLVKSEKGSLVLVKAKKKKGQGDDAKYHIMWDWVFGPKGKGIEGLYNDIDAKNRKNAEGLSGKQLTTFHIKPHPHTKDPNHKWYDPDGTSGYGQGASRNELNTLIGVANAVHSLQNGEPGAMAELEKMKKFGHFSDELMDALLYNEKAQAAAIKLGSLARQSQVDRVRNKELQTYVDKEGNVQHKTAHNIIDPVTGMASANPARRGSGERAPYQGVRTKDNPDFVDLSGGLGGDDDDDSAADSIFGGGGPQPPTNAAMNTVRQSRLNPDGTVDRSKGTEVPMEEEEEPMPSHEELMEMFRRKQLGNMDEGDA